MVHFPQSMFLLFFLSIKMQSILAVGRLDG